MRTDDYHQVFDSNISVIIAKHTPWNSTKINEFGEILYRHVRQRNVIALGLLEHTFFLLQNQRTPSNVLDFVLLKDIGHSTDVGGGSFVRP